MSPRSNIAPDRPAIRIAVLPVIFLLLTSTFCVNRGVQETDRQIDSLIEVDWINKKTLLTSFGADAVSAIQTSEGIVVIDAGISTGLTSRFRDKITNAFQDDRISAVIYTHAHPDHVGGSPIFEDARIIGHANGIGEMEKREKDPAGATNRLTQIAEEYEKRLNSASPYTDQWKESFTQQVRYQEALADAKSGILPVKPRITFSDSLNHTIGATTFELKYFGVCHSNSDIFIYVPQWEILFTGDLIFEYGRPSINQKLTHEFEQWQEAISWVNDRINSVETCIGGHGQTLSPEDLDFFQRTIQETIDRKDDNPTQH